MEQKVVIASSEQTINNHLVDGWKVKMVTGGGGEYKGQTIFCFVLERTKLAKD